MQKIDSLTTLAEIPLTVAEDLGTFCSLCQTERRTDKDCMDGWIECEPLAAGYAPAMGRCIQWQALLDSQRLAKSLGNSNLDESQYEQSWETLEIIHDSWKAAATIARNIEEIINNGVNLVFLGHVGTGKTLASVLLCKDAVKQGYSSLKVDWSKFLDGIKDSYSDKGLERESKQFERLEACDLLLLDDIGAGEKDENRYSQSRLEKIISRRYDRKKSTIVTANFNPNQLSEVLGKRAASRITGRMMQVSFNGPSYRVAKERESVQAVVSKIWAEAKS